MINRIEEERHAESNIVLELAPKPAIKENFYCIPLGYIDRDMQKGDRVFIRPEEIAILYRVLKEAVEKNF